MDAPTILDQIKSMETADIAPDSVAEIYAYALSLIEGNITEADLRRLIVLGAAMYRNSTKGLGAELQIPISGIDEDNLNQGGPGKDLLH